MFLIKKGKDIHWLIFIIREFFFYKLSTTVKDYKRTGFFSWDLLVPRRETEPSLRGRPETYEKKQVYQPLKPTLQTI